MKKILIGLCLYLFTLTAFAKNTILIVGDSISAGYNINIDQGWVKLLQKKLDKNNYDYQVINLSVSGSTTSNGLAKLPAALTQYHPQITIIELGGNDGLRGLQIPTIKQNLLKMISLVKKAKSKVLVLGLRLPPNYGAEYTSQFQIMFAEIAQEQNISLVPFFLQGVDDKVILMQADNTHPTVEAQSILLENVWGSLEKLL